jgi:hypothetical protein
MRAQAAAMMYRSLVAALLLSACQESEPTTTNNLGLELTTISDVRVEGTMTTMTGSVDFVVEETAPGIVDVSFDRGQGAFGTKLDWNTRSADFAWTDGMTVTDDDRFVLTALATAVEAEVGKDTIVTDNLFRQASLWGAHPTGDIVLQPITGEAGHSWTTLCSAGACNSTATYRTFYHSGGNTERSAPCGYHPGSTYGHSRRFGRTDPTNPCLSRCGAGCNGVGTSAWTQDCGNHDICEYWHTSDCGGELSSASDDFSFAPNCGC